ncbi:MAG: hypothetical protein MUC56_09100 [Thermoanaerobaculales bacterium]|jgi:hypothetical protein|nr:hypothetical protein [Thermoanaerobaculales bacterium]
MTTRCVTLCLVGLTSLLAAAPSSASAENGGWVEGTLLVAWSTPEAGVAAPSLTAASLALDDGRRLDLGLDADDLAGLGGPGAVAGARVRVLLPSGGGGSPVRPLALEPLAGGGFPDASGSYPYVSLMCAFPDVALPSEGLSYFQGMYANVMPGLDHYWRAQSYDMVDVVGSTAAGWFTLPHNRSHYTDMISGNNYSVMLGALYDDCTGVASGSVNLPSYVGINLMFNETFGPYAWGGWGGVTWEPPWGWRNVAVIGHEMGHAFGLPHSNNADGDSDPYDNPWDVMSNSWGYALSDQTYGTVGKHTISYHKDILGWIPAARKTTVSTAGYRTFDIDHLTLAGTANLHLVRVVIPGSSRFYTVEVRDRTGYDGNLPGFAVILHEVDPGRQEPAWLVDLVDPANGADAGAMWLPGECFDDAANQILICVDSVTAEGYRVEIGYGEWSLLFDDGFENGTTSAWSSTAP